MVEITESETVAMVSDYFKRTKESDAGSISE